MKKILITSGGTKEYIDEVRVLTNISTGKLGALIADTIIKQTEDMVEIHFVYVKGSELPKSDGFIRMRKTKDTFPYNYNCLKFHEVTDVKSVYDIMEKLVPEMDVVIHPMAVSDFGFRPIDKKLKSNDPEAFIESMRERIYQTPKILSKIKEWNPNCFLISFKFENNISNEELMSIATNSLINNKCDLVVANDKAEMKRVGDHMSYFISRMDSDSFKYEPIKGKENIAIKIFHKIK